MFILACLLPLLPLITPILAVPSVASSVDSIQKRDDCHGSGNCGKDGSSIAALEIYNQFPNNESMYNDYTSYNVGHYAAMYTCPKGKYPAGITGADLFNWGQQIFKPKNVGGDQCGFCGTHWLEDTDNSLKCRMTLNWCKDCTETVNGVQGAGAGLPPPPTPAAAAAAAVPPPPPSPAAQVPAAQVPAAQVPAAQVPAAQVPAAQVPAAQVPAIPAAPVQVPHGAGVPTLSSDEESVSGEDPISQLDEYDAQFDSDDEDSDPMPGEEISNPMPGGMGSSGEGYGY